MAQGPGIQLGEKQNNTHVWEEIAHLQMDAFATSLEAFVSFSSLEVLETMVTLGVTFSSGVVFLKYAGIYLILGQFPVTFKTLCFSLKPRLTKLGK